MPEPTGRDGRPPTLGKITVSGQTMTSAEVRDELCKALVLDLINRRQVSAVVVNPQTSTTAITSLRDTARRAGVPVAEVAETLPDGTDYLSWQRNTVNQLVAALQSSRPVQP